MSEASVASAETAQSGSDDMLAVLFAQMVIQQSNMAMVLMGKVPHPESGEVVRDLEAARLFIDQLEMLEVKTKGNLSKQEVALLKQSLMSLRMAFVEAAESEPAAAQAAPKQAPPTTSAPAAEPDKSTSAASSAEAEEHRKKFVKKY